MPIRTNEPNFVEVGWYQAREASKLIEKLEETEIRYRMRIDDSLIKELSPPQVRYGGSFGNGAQVLVL